MAHNGLLRMAREKRRSHLRIAFSAEYLDYPWNLAHQAEYHRAQLLQQDCGFQRHGTGSHREAARAVLDQRGEEQAL